MSNRTISDAEKYERLREWGEKNLDMDAVTQMEQFIRFLDQRAKRFQEKVIFSSLLFFFYKLFSFQQNDN